VAWGSMAPEHAPVGGALGLGRRPFEKPAKLLENSLGPGGGGGMGHSLTSALQAMPPGVGAIG
jgi:hypothetical protein